MRDRDLEQDAKIVISALESLLPKGDDAPSFSSKPWSFYTDIGFDILDWIGEEPNMQTREGAFFTPDQEAYAKAVFTALPTKSQMTLVERKHQELMAVCEMLLKNDAQHTLPKSGG